jgi:hypothetical protein
LGARERSGSRRHAMRSTPESTISIAPTAGHFYSPGALEPLDRAAARLGNDPEALRELCEVAAERCGDVAVAYLEAGVVAFNTDGCWRFRLPVSMSAAAPQGDDQ